MPTAVALVVAALAFVAVLTVAETCGRKWLLPDELARKLAHISSSILAAALPLAMPFPAIVVLAASFIPFMILSRRLGLFMVVHRAERSTLGEVYFPLGVLLVAALVPHQPAYAFGVLVMGISDAVAGLGGQRFGRRAYRLFAATKTYVGSFGFLVTTVVLGLLTVASADAVSGRALVGVMTIAAVVTLEEAVVGGGADNAVLPISAAALLRLLG